MNMIDNILSCFNNSGINYCILRGYDELYESEDIDILIDKQEKERLEGLMRQLGFIQKKSSLTNHIFYIRYDIELNKLVKFDIITDIFYGHKSNMFKCPISKVVLENKYSNGKVYLPHYEHQLLLLVLHCIINKRDFSEYKNKISELIDQIDKGYLRFGNQFETYLGINYPELESKIRLGQINNLLYEKKQIVRKLLKSNHPTTNIINISKVLLYKITNKTKTILMLRYGTLISFIGCDGAGKSTIIDEVSRDLLDKGIYRTKYIYLGNKNYLLPTSKFIYNLKRRKNNEKSKVKVKSKVLNRSYQNNKILRIKRLLNSINRWFEMAARNLMLLYYLKKGFLIITDRYFYDYINPRTKKENKILLNYFIRPRHVFYLKARKEILYERKHEYTISEYESMIEKYNYVSSIIENCSVVDTEKEIKDTIRKFYETVWKDIVSIK